MRFNSLLPGELIAPPPVSKQQVVRSLLLAHVLLHCEVMPCSKPCT